MRKLCTKSVENLETTVQQGGGEPRFNEPLWPMFFSFHFFLVPFVLRSCLEGQRHAIFPTPHRENDHVPVNPWKSPSSLLLCGRNHMPQGVQIWAWAHWLMWLWPSGLLHSPSIRQVLKGQWSGTGRQRFRRAQFQTPSSVSFLLSPSFGERAQWAPLSLLYAKANSLSFFFAKLNCSPRGGTGGAKPGSGVQRFWGPLGASEFDPSFQ